MVRKQKQQAQKEQREIPQSGRHWRQTQLETQFVEQLRRIAIQAATLSVASGADAEASQTNQLDASRVVFRKIGGLWLFAQRQQVLASLTSFATDSPSFTDFVASFSVRMLLLEDASPRWPAPSEASPVRQKATEARLSAHS